MATVTLKYGRDGLHVDLPDSPGFAGVLEPRHQPALPDPERAVRESLDTPITAPPLGKVAEGRSLTRSSAPTPPGGIG